jgi:ribosomal protein S17E
MATKNFDSLFEQLTQQLSEAPVYSEPETFKSNLKGGIGAAPGGGYGIGKLADALQISKEEAVDLISQEIYDKVFPDGVNPANNDMAYRTSIANAVKEVVSKVAQEKDIELKGMGNAVAGYTARVVDQLTKADKQYGSSATQQEVQSAVETDSDESVENGAPAEPKAPKAARYIDEAEYEILTPDEMSAAGVELRDDLKTYYSRIENIADQVQKGKDITKAIQRGGTDTGSATKAAAALIRAGAIKYASAENSDQDVEALEREDGDIDEIGRSEFEKYYSGAYRDAKASEPKAMSYGFED